VCGGSTTSVTPTRRTTTGRTCRSRSCWVSRSSTTSWMRVEHRREMMWHSRLEAVSGQPPRRDANELDCVDHGGAQVGADPSRRSGCCRHQPTTTTASMAGARCSLGPPRPGHVLCCPRGGVALHAVRGGCCCRASVLGLHGKRVPGGLTCRFRASFAGAVR
jgi:hypothetical protein